MNKSITSNFFIKHILLGLSMVIMVHFCKAQKIGEQVIFKNHEILRNPGYVVAPSNELELDKFYTVKCELIVSPDIKKLKKNKKETIVFGSKYQKYYFVGKLKRKNLGRIYYSFELEGDIYYHDSKTIYKSTELNEKGELLSETYYYKTGGIRTVNINENCEGCQRTIIYNKDGDIIKAFTNKTHTNILVKDHKERGEIMQKFWSKYEIKPNVLTQNRSIYIGWPHVGSLHTEKGYVLTGFHYPLKLELGNASVLFLENEKTDSCFWTLLIDGRIRQLIPAKREEKPDIEELYRNTRTEVFNMEKTDLRTTKWASKNTPKNILKGPYRIYHEEVVSIQSKNINTLNGYGISLRTLDNYGIGDSVVLEIGFFENGKLNGLGYSANLLYKLGYTPKSVSRANVNGIEWKADFGIFQHGELASGNGIYTVKAYPKYLDVFSEMPYDNYKFMQRKHFSNLSNLTVPFSKVDKKYYFYIPELKRRLGAKSIDYEAKTVTLYTDTEGAFRTFTQEDDVWAFQSNITTYRIKCPAVVTRPNYVNKKVPLYQYPPEYSTTTRRVNGVYFDKIITTRTYKGPGKTVYTEKSVQEGYKQVTCPDCQGKGYILKDKQEGAFCKIDFDK